MKNLYKASCVLIALMFVSVSCFAALGPGESKSVSDATVLSAQSGEEGNIESDYFSIYVPVSEGSSELVEIRFHTGKMPGSESEISTRSGSTKVVPFTYYAHEELGGLTIQHYTGWNVYISTTVAGGIATGVSTADAIASILGLAAPEVAAVVAAIGLLGYAFVELYPNGAVFVLATAIHLTKVITIPINPPRVLEVYSQ